MTFIPMPLKSTELHEVTLYPVITKMLPVSRELAEQYIKRDILDEAWRIVEHSEKPEIVSRTVPQIAIWEPCIEVTYIDGWDAGGEGPYDGDTAYVPARLVQQFGIEVAFEMTTETPARYITEYDEMMSSFYDYQGRDWYEVQPQMSLAEFVRQAVEWPLAYTVFQHSVSGYTLIAHNATPISAEQTTQVIHFNLYTPGKQSPMRQYNMRKTINQEILTEIAGYIDGTAAADNILGIAQPTDHLILPS